MNRKKTQNIALAAIFTAAITALTMVHLPLPSEAGYVHIGDSMIYLAASFLPAPYAIVAAALGGALADMVFGFFNWMPFTFVIKALNVIPFVICFKYSKKSQQKIITLPSVVMSLVSGVVTVVLYFFASWVVYGNAATAWLDVPGSVVQAAGSTVIYCLAGVALDASKIKTKLNRR
ncbi:MAG: TIGR04002 family protein [Clostridia bacterium]|nr:TIGR04002 family protein [Clostridia bacterium]